MLESRGPAVQTNPARMVHRLDAKVRKNVTRLAGKVAVVTGGGSGIGRAIALALGRESAQVAVLGRRGELLDAVVGELKTTGAEAMSVVCDVRKAAECRRAVEAVGEKFGLLNVLVNNAGVLSVSTVESATEEEWDRVLETNLKGPFLMARAALPWIRKSGGGSIINIASVLGLVAMKDRAVYCASKGGVALLTKAMALDHASEKIRVNCICPAIVETELVKDLFSGAPEMEKARKETLPLGRFGQPADVAELAVFLASDDSAWMTGTAIPVDGGLTAY